MLVVEHWHFQTILVFNGSNAKATENKACQLLN